MDKPIIVFNLKYLHDLVGEAYSHNQDKDLAPKLDYIDHTVWWLIKELEKDINERKALI